VTKVLKPFRDAQLSLEGEKYVSSSYVVPHIYTCRCSLEHGNSVLQPDSICELSEMMSEDFDVRWGRHPIFDTGNVVRGYRSRQERMHLAFVISTFLHPSLKALNGMGVSAASKVCLDDYILDLMVGVTVAGDDGSSNNESDDGDDDNGAVVVPTVENAMTRIIQENITEQDDNSLSSEYSIREECKDELRNYKCNVARVPMKGKFPDAIGWWKK